MSNLREVWADSGACLIIEGVEVRISKTIGRMGESECQEERRFD